MALGCNLMTIFEEAKNKLNIISVAETYGINVVNGKNAVCPFHNDKHPSISFKGDICTCWVCNKSYDSIALVAELFNLSSLDAVKKLNQDFGLNLDIGQPVSREHIRQINKENELLNNFDTWERKAFNILATYHCYLFNNKKQYEPTIDEFVSNNISPLYVQACHKLDYIEYLTDVFIYGTFEDKVQLYRTHKGEVKKIGDKIRKIRDSKIA